MSLFQSVLFQLSKKLLGNEKEKELIAKIVTDVIKIPISPDVISIKEGKVFIQAPPTIRSAIRLHNNEIITVLKKQHITIFFIG